MVKSALFPEKVFVVGDERIVVRPFSFFEIMVEVPAIMGRIIDSISDAGPNLSIRELVTSCSKEILALMVFATGKPDEFWKQVPAEQGIEIMNAFLEVNLSENFFDLLVGAVDRWKKIGSRLFSSS